MLLLLLAHRVWIAAGTAKKPKFIPLDDVYRKLPAETEKAILQCHVIAGSTRPRTCLVTPRRPHGRC
jgi:hypothetical protein